MKWYLFSMLTVFYVFPFGQDALEYGNKSIQKTLRKLLKSDHVRLNRLEDSLLLTEKKGILPGKYFKVTVPSRKGVQYYLYVGRVNSCRAGGCSSSSGKLVENIEYEYFDYFILFRVDGTVFMVKVFHYAATHGQEITSRGWLKQFSGYSAGQSLEIGKNIDAISGATVSVYAITLDVQHKTQRLKQILENKKNRTK